MARVRYIYCMLDSKYLEVSTFLALTDPCALQRIRYNSTTSAFFFGGSHLAVAVVAEVGVTRMF